MRVTDNMLQRSVLSDVGQARTRLAQVQEQASSGLRINRPSDDPVGYRSASALRATLEASAQLLRNHDRGLERLNRQDSALDEIQDLVQRARELTLRGANGTVLDEPEQRQILSDEIAGIHAQLLAQANVEGPDGYLFAGHANDAPPFVQVGSFETGPPGPTVSFIGDSNQIEVELERNVRVLTTLDGRRVFLGDGDGNGTPDAGREDIFAVLSGVWSALRANDPDATQAQIDRLDRVATQLSTERTRVGTATQRVEAASSAVRDQSVDLERQLSNVQDADTVSVLSELVSRETALQSALQAASRVLQPSLLNFLR